MAHYDEPYHCPICESTTGSIRQPYKGTSAGFVGRSIIECSSCHILHVFPLPTEEEISRHYDTYWDAQYLESMLPLFAKQSDSRIAFLLPYLPDSDPLTVLDVGAGFGLMQKSLAAVLPNRSLHYDAVEVDPLAAAYLANTIRPRALYRSTRDTTEQYHIIILSHILEHMRDPLHFLRHHWNMLRDNGIVFVEVPNQDFLFKAQNEPHLFFYAPQELSSVMTRAGYEVLDVRTCGQSIHAMSSAPRSDSQVRAFIRHLLPGRVLDFLRLQLGRSHAKTTAKSVSEYRKDGRWIRLAARKGASPSAPPDHVKA